MKKLLLLCLLLFAGAVAFAQNYYAEQWKKIESNTRSGNYVSNLPLINEIQSKAMKEKNTVQIIRSLKAEFGILQTTEDDAKNDMVSKFFKKLKEVETTFSGNDLLMFQVLTGEFFIDYFNENQWEISQRTNIDHQDFAQIENWSKLDFKNYLTSHFQTLNAKEQELKNIQLLPYKEIFEDTDDFNYFHTLFDWTAQRQINFLQNTSYFTPNERKANQSKILELYSKLAANNSGNPQLYFLHQKTKFACEITRCKNLQQDLQNLVSDENTAGDYKAAIILDLMDQLIAKKQYVAALQWATKAEKMFPGSAFLNGVQNRKNSISNPQLTVFYERATVPGQAIHIVAEGKNVRSFSLSIYDAKGDLDNFLTYAADEYSASKYKNVKKTLVRRENFEMPSAPDYTTHSTSFEIKPLPAGIYIAEYAVNGAVQDHFYFIVSHSRVLDYNKGGGKISAMKLVNRENGKAYPNEVLKITEVTGPKFTTVTSNTDANGIFQLPKSASERYYRHVLILQPSTNDFNLVAVYGSHNVSPADNRGETVKAQIFIDRGIYRPGQTVYFKVINTQLVKSDEAVSAGLTQSLSLYDTNGEKVSTQKFTTNEFGSYNGSFILPGGKLNGSFSLRIDGYGGQFSRYFSVEEYKRPKFEVTFEPIKSEYKYGETIELKGKAMTFSGIALNNTEVEYEIKKQDIRWRYFWWFPRGEANENSILGSAKTNEKGEFTIKLELEKDPLTDGIQVDSYNVNASVTDVNGETQSATQDVKVASVSHYIESSELTDAFSDEDVQIKVQTKNYNGENLSKSYHVKLSKLKADERIYRSNFENKIQDRPQLSKEEFIQKFPHDYFSKEERKSAPVSVLIDGKIRNEPTLDLGKLSVGKYLLELYNIEGKDAIKTKREFEVLNKNSMGENKPFLKVISPKGEVKRSGKAKFFVYSAVPDAVVNIFIQNGDGTTKTEHRSLKNGLLVYETGLPQDENIDRLNLQFQLVAFNDVQTQTAEIQIASDKKPLSVETVSFRDKLQPGQKEKWSIKVSGNDKEKVTAEILAAMYDKSLDQFAGNSWTWEQLRQRVYRISQYGISENLNHAAFSGKMQYKREKYIVSPDFRWMDQVIRHYSARVSYAEMATDSAVSAPPPPISKQLETTAALKNQAGLAKPKTETPESEISKIPVRQNLKETAFFYPDLLTDQNGNVTFEFTSPEALTQWKLMFLAHTKDSRAATLERTVVTQKDFSVMPNYPRFLREGDELNLQTKLSSLVDNTLTGTAQLQILDAFTNEDISAKFSVSQSSQTFTVDANSSTALSWKIKAPKDVSSVIFKIVAKAGAFSDGEQMAIPVLPNRMLVTDAVPIFVKEGQTKTFVLENLAKNTSTTATNFANTLELATNPIWEVMFALPSLKNDQNNSADVIFNKWFADVLAAEIFKANPKLKTVFDEYQSKGLLQSNLERNQELKQLLLEETPWVLESKDESEQMQMIARLFDANTMQNSIRSDWEELQKLQNPDGGFSWYSGYPSSYYTSLYILKNLGKINEWLKGNVNDYQASAQKNMVAKLIAFVDEEVYKYWEVKKENVWNNYVLDFLDTRRYWETSHPLIGKGAQLRSLVIKKGATADIKDFTFFGLHRAALLFNSYKLTAVSKKLMTYLKETSIQSQTQGVYWKQNLNDWGWYSSKTVNQAGALEAFNKLTPNDIDFIEEMKIWLVTQKEVNSWGTSRGTAEVIFTLMNSGKSWAGPESDKATVIWNGKEVKTPETAATGYLKTSVRAETVDKGLGTVTVTKPGPGIVQGGLFWQYYEDLDKIKSSETYISISKELYGKIKTVNGEELQKITSGTPLKIGDKVTVRMILNTDRNMEFIHLKDMRAAGFEPLNVISGYEWKGGLGYYQSTKDASTNFYIQYMPKGKYVFEYDYICNASGTFSNGITTLQNYYAPQMNAHTDGSIVVIGE